MKPKTLILLVVAVGCGLVASYMTSRVIADRSTSQEVNTVAVVYAMKNVQQGFLVKNPEEHFEVRMIPDKIAPRGKVIRELSELKDKRLINPVGADKHISHDDLLNPQDTNLSYRIPPGMRAISVKVSTDTSVSGFVLPGMFVDIMCVPNGRVECKTIMQKVQVLAVNQVDTRDPDKRTLETNFVTFAVTPDDGEKLALASHAGHLRLSLRHVDDDKVASTPGAKPEDLSRLSRDTSEAALQSDTTTTSTQTTPTPILPQPPLESVAAAQPSKQPEPPPQPKVLWTMTIRDGTKVQQHKFYDEPPIGVEKSDPDGEPEPAPAPTRREGKSPERSSQDESTSPVKNPGGK